MTLNTRPYKQQTPEEAQRELIDEQWRRSGPIHEEIARRQFEAMRAMPQEEINQIHSEGLRNVAPIFFEPKYRDLSSKAGRRTFLPKRKAQWVIPALIVANLLGILLALYLL